MEGGPKVVDVHAHAVPLALLDWMREGSGRDGVPVLSREGRIRFGHRLTPVVPPSLWDVPARLAEMERTGVDLQVVSPWMELNPDGLPAPAAAAFLRQLNDTMAELVDREPDRLRALALVDHRDPGAATAGLVRCAQRRGFLGVEIAAGGRPGLHEPEWDPFWEAASENGALVLLHPWRAEPVSGLTAPGLGDIVDNPAQSTATVGAMVLAGVFERFPELRICVVHGGGFLPYQAGRFDAIARLQPGWHERRTMPSSLLKRLHYDSLTHSATSLTWLLEFAGPDRVLLGSDYPFPTGNREAAAAIRDLPAVDEAARAMVLGGNACRLMRQARS
jgi:aminocarboxymuconate-semialdehyde decarboxylase